MRDVRSCTHELMEQFSYRPKAFAVLLKDDARTSTTPEAMLAEISQKDEVNVAYRFATNSGANRSE